MPRFQTKPHQKPLRVFLSLIGSISSSCSNPPLLSPENVIVVPRVPLRDTDEPKQNLWHSSQKITCIQYPQDETRGEREYRHVVQDLYWYHMQTIGASVWRAHVNARGRCQKGEKVRFHSWIILPYLADCSHHGNIHQLTALCWTKQYFAPYLPAAFQSHRLLFSGRLIALKCVIRIT